MMNSFMEKSNAVVFLVVVRLWELMQSPTNLSLDYIHRPAGHVTVLMLKNALVNINRPGWQDKFAFMPLGGENKHLFDTKAASLLQWRPPS